MTRATCGTHGPYNGPRCPSCFVQAFYDSRDMMPGVVQYVPAAASQVGGDHYTRLPVQPWSAMEAWMSPEEFRGYLRGCAIKYLARDKGKRVEDYKKARHYLDKLIEEMEATP